MCMVGLDVSCRQLSGYLRKHVLPEAVVAVEQRVSEGHSGHCVGHSGHVRVGQSSGKYIDLLEYID